jgi:hypothetical protein
MSWLRKQVYAGQEPLSSLARRRSMVVFGHYEAGVEPTPADVKRFYYLASRSVDPEEWRKMKGDWAWKKYTHSILAEQMSRM